MTYKTLDLVVLEKDLPGLGLRRGDLGTVVHVHDSDVVEVEFVTASGRTEALTTLHVGDVCPVDSTDLIAVRRLERTA